MKKSRPEGVKKFVAPPQILTPSAGPVMDDAMVGKKMINFLRNKLNDLIITKMIKRAN